MCDDSDPDDYGDEDEPHEPEQPDDEPAPTPGERLLYALGQLYRLYRHGALPSPGPYRRRWKSWEAALLHFGYTPDQVAERLEQP